MTHSFRVLCNIGYRSETHLKLKSREISFVHNLLLSKSIVLKFCTEHDSEAAVLCAKFQNDWWTENSVMDERVFARFESDMSFRRISILYCTRPQSISQNIKACVKIFIFYSNFSALWILIIGNNTTFVVALTRHWTQLLHKRMTTKLDTSFFKMSSASVICYD